MKKILLNLVLVALALSSYGQTTNVTDVPIANIPLDHSSQLDQSKKQINTTKNRGTRTYSYISSIDVVEYLSSGSFNATACPIWEDSTILVRYTGGYGAINFASVAASFNPTADIYNDPTYYAGEMEISDSEPYTIDSIYLTGIYMTPNASGATAGDKLRISVVTTGNNNTVTYLRGQSRPGVSNYLGSTADTAIYGATAVADPVGRIGGDPSLTNRVVWDYNFTDADTSSPSPTNSYTWRTWGFKPPTAINVAAGERAVVTFTFFSGDTWNANADSVSFSAGAGSKNHFRARFFEENAQGQMTYRDYSERNGGDFNNSSLMFTTFTEQYSPSVFIEAGNTTGFGFEQLDVDWVVTCAGCWSVGVNDLDNILSDVNVYPNPVESGNLNVDFTTASTLNNAAVNLMDMTGKVVFTQKLNTVQANNSIKEEINLDGISSGMYFFSLTSDQGKFVKKVVIK